jgi:hypothetical protein
LYNASIERVDTNNINIDHLMDQIETNEETTQPLPGMLSSSDVFVKISLIEPQSLDLIKLNKKVVLNCSLLLTDGNLNYWINLTK